MFFLKKTQKIFINYLDKYLLRCVMNHRIFTIFLVIILFGMSYSLAQDDTTSYNNIGVSDIGGANDFCEDCACRDAEAVDESYSICRNIEESKSVDDAVYRLG